MHVLESEFGLRVISYDELLKDEAPARATMRHWLEGAGAASPSSGLAFVRAESGQDESTQPQPGPQEKPVASTASKFERCM